MMHQNRDLTEGKIGSSLLLFSLPMILGNLLQQMYNIADTLLVGKIIGPAALAAVGSSYALMVLLTSVILGLCMGSGVVFANYYGAKKYKEMKNSIYNAFLFILLFSVLLNVTAFLLLDNLLVWLNIPEESLEYTREYLQIVFCGFFFVTVYNFLASILRSIGNTLVPLLFLVVSAVSNIILDIWFMAGLHMGVKGAALATLISQIFSAVGMMVYFGRKGKHLWPGREERFINKKVLWSIVNQSSLTALQQSIMNFGILLVQGLVNSLGFAVSVAFAAGVKVDAFAYMPAQDFGNAFSTFVAQNHGSDKRERIQKGTRTAMGMSGLFCLLSSVCVWLLAGPLMKLFVKAEETKIIEIGKEYLRTEGACYIGIGILFLLYGYYRGIGKPGMSIVLTVISLGSRVFLAYMLSGIPDIGRLGIWWSVPIGWALADAFGIIIYFLEDKTYKMSSIFGKTERG